MSDLARTLDAVAVFVRRFVVMSDHQLVAVTLWVMHVHAFEASDYTPYPFVNSAERESGKSRLKEVCEILVANPVSTVNISPAALFRIASPEDKPPSTFLVDELDEIFAPKSERSELRGLLNAGFRRGETVIRMVGEGSKMKPVPFPVYCPKLLAGKSSAALGDTLESRCIRIELKRKTRDEQVERFRRRDVEEEAGYMAETLRSLAQYNLDRLAVARPHLPEELSDRQQDVWEPLLAIADLAEGSWPARARSAAIALSTGSEPEESLGVRLLADCRAVRNDAEQRGEERIKSHRLIELLCLLEESPWGEKWWDGFKGEQKSSAAQNMGRHLKRYGIKSRKHRFEEGPRMGYEWADFEDAWVRYLPPLLDSGRNSRNSPHEHRESDPLPGRNTNADVPTQDDGSNPHKYSNVPTVPAEDAQNGRNGLPESEHERAELRDRVARVRLERKAGEQTELEARLRGEFEPDPSDEEIERLAELYRETMEGGAA